MPDWEDSKMNTTIDDLIDEVRLTQMRGDCTDDQVDDAIDILWDMYADRYNFDTLA
jgi:hypothetical protein